jgi:hypothetical protein
MYFIGKLILINDIRNIVIKMTVNVKDLLWDFLMFKEGKDVWFIIPLTSIEDDLT